MEDRFVVDIMANDLLTKPPNCPLLIAKLRFDLFKLSLIYHVFLFIFFCRFQMSRTLESSPNALINKKVLDRYLTLELPENKIQATYIWIDGTDQNIRCKDRTLDFVPKSVKGKLSPDRNGIFFLLFAVSFDSSKLIDNVKTWNESDKKRRAKRFDRTCKTITTTTNRIQNKFVASMHSIAIRYGVMRTLNNEQAKMG